MGSQGQCINSGDGNKILIITILAAIYWVCLASLV